MIYYQPLWIYSVCLISALHYVLSIQAIERRRARLGEENGETAEDQFPSLQVQDASPEHQVLAATPSTIKKRPCPPSSVLKVHKILLEVANQPDEGEFVTPQKKLLNSIDKVEKVVRTHPGITPLTPRWTCGAHFSILWAMNLSKDPLHFIQPILSIRGMELIASPMLRMLWMLKIG
ncbi:hypothetical protein RchiOBHm_Chr7g0219161 [Rosa chinensis]|uniref:Uncharacterized protein n=1 Tax=Rosa chinensis TaxID=74649 RepID=A0A2P6PCG1_ROSCH|nr:hypothetical protein RchiOBHm_Chr7g0219161 [Rosa chinensis]